MNPHPAPSFQLEDYPQSILNLETEPTFSPEIDNAPVLTIPQSDF